MEFSWLSLSIYCKKYIHFIPEIPKSSNKQHIDIKKVPWAMIKNEYQYYDKIHEFTLNAIVHSEN